MPSDLDWPEEFDRTGPRDREPYPHGFRVTRSQAFENILDELRKMGATNVQLDTGAEHQQRNPNKPYANASFDDPGVVVRYEHEGEQRVIPCDRWDNPRDNAQAIARYLDAKRALGRYGVETIQSEFDVNQLPPAGADAIAMGDGNGHGDRDGREPHEVLGVSPDAPEPVIRGAFRELVKRDHGDHGGDGDVDALRKARDALLEGRDD